ncbi:nuclear transport factor 2 family protein [Microtetraspora sp. AC03309]|uniref:nuclear transport factor 2 family protein n=1 Tax=Microtetraspora sp. AC03309 TaxID=2779376 RepID=UPI001E4CA26D|nr:nuclear transport factor 2 family protein [Microtetraspora sp. AC03309]MCC5578008.1 nuclear transport factor 2 family protein [Microtetraspora sp. AC03309]
MTETRRTLEERVAEQERIAAIKALKYRYWRACDAKDVETFRDSFIREGASIRFGRMGDYDDAAGLVAVFEKVALRKVDGRYVILDMHHGIHPDITLLSDTEAVGRWTLRFRQINLIDNTEKLGAVEYDDAYVVEDGRWKKSKCHVRELWSIVRPLPEGAVVTQGF